MIREESTKIPYVENGELIIDDSIYEKISAFHLHETDLDLSTKLIYQFIFNEEFYNYFIEMRKNDKNLLIIKNKSNNFNYKFTFSQIINSLRCVEWTGVQNQRIGYLQSLCNVEKLYEDYGKDPF